MSLVTRIGALVLAAAALCWTTLSAAAPPQTLTIQGHLRTSGGTPVNGNTQVTFRLYDVASGGSALWSETHPALPVENGVYSATLGNSSPLTLSFDTPYFLGVTVASDAEMTPRHALSSVAYAFRATTAATADSVPSTDKLGMLTAADHLRRTITNVPRGNAMRNADPPGKAGGEPVASTASATGADGLPIVAYVAGSKLRFVRCATSDCGSGAPVTLATDAKPSPVHLGVASDGLPFIAYLGTTNSFIKCGDASCSSGNTTYPLEAPAIAGVGVGGDGLPLVAFKNLSILRCANQVCSSYTMVARADGIAISGGDQPHATMVMGLHGPLFVWTSANTGGGSTIWAAQLFSLDWTVYNFGAAATSPRDIVDGALAVAVPRDGIPIIAFHTGGEYAGIARGGTVTYLPTAAPPGGGPALPPLAPQMSIAVPADGLPVISVQARDSSGSTPLGVVVLKCNAAACDSVGWRYVDGIPGSGRHNSITVAGDGMPFLAYQASDTTLRVLKCGSEFCAPFFSRR